jgi:hypothetical protein
MMRIVMGKIEDEVATHETESKDPGAAELGRKCGQARARTVTAGQRAATAKEAASRWWEKEKP